MDIYGLTGGIGSGKTAVARLLESYGVPVVSADELSRMVVTKGSDGLRDVVRRFGPSVLTVSGELDRKRVAGLVFEDPDLRRELEAILHPRIRERYEQVLDALEKAGHPVVIYEVPLLFEKNLHTDMKAVILVTADESTRIARVRARDELTDSEVRARMAAQMDEDTKRKRADYIIENNGSIDALRREVEFLLARFLRLPERRPNAGQQLARQITPWRGVPSADEDAPSTHFASPPDGPEATPRPSAAAANSRPVGAEASVESVSATSHVSTRVVTAADSSSDAVSPDRPLRLPLLPRPVPKSPHSATEGREAHLAPGGRESNSTARSEADD